MEEDFLIAKLTRQRKRAQSEKVKKLVENQVTQDETRGQDASSAYTLGGVETSVGDQKSNNLNTYGSEANNNDSKSVSTLSSQTINQPTDLNQNKLETTEMLQKLKTAELLVTDEQVFQKLQTKKICKAFLCPGEPKDIHLVRRWDGYDYIHVPFISRHGEYLKAIPIKPTNGVESMEETFDFDLSNIYIVPPQHYMDPDSRSRVDTEPRIKAVLNECWLRYKEEMGQGTEWTQPTNFPQTAKGRKFERVDSNGQKFGEVTLYVWRPSPTLNWKLKGRVANKEYYSTYLKLQGENFDDLCSIDGSDNVKVPFSNIVAYPCVRFEIIMLSYRYVSVVINRVIRDFNSREMGNGIDEVPSDFRDGLNKLNDIHMSLLDVTNCIADSFNIMKNIVTPVLSAWTTLPENQPIAELTQECCMMYQHLLTSIRLIYSSRITKIFYFIKQLEERKAKSRLENKTDFFETLYTKGIAMTEVNFDIEGVKMFDMIKPKRDFEFGPGVRGEEKTEVSGDNLVLGHTPLQWGRLDMGITLSLFSAIEIYDNVIDLRFGSRQRPCNVTMESFNPIRSRFSDMFRNYLVETLILYFIRSLSFHTLELKCQYSKLLIDENSEEFRLGSKMDGQKMTAVRRVKEQIISIAQVGLVLCRPLLCSGRLYFDYARLEHERFKKILYELYPTLNNSELFGDDDEDPETEVETTFSTTTDYESENTDTEMSSEELTKLYKDPSTKTKQTPRLFKVPPNKTQYDQSTMMKIQQRYSITGRKSLGYYMEKIAFLFKPDNCNFLLDKFPLESRDKLYMYPPSKHIPKTNSFLQAQTIKIDLHQPTPVTPENYKNGCLQKSVLPEKDLDSQPSFVNIDEENAKQQWLQYLKTFEG